MFDRRSCMSEDMGRVYHWKSLLSLVCPTRERSKEKRTAANPHSARPCASSPRLQGFGSSRRPTARGRAFPFTPRGGGSLSFVFNDPSRSRGWLCRDPRLPVRTYRSVRAGSDTTQGLAGRSAANTCVERPTFAKATVGGARRAEAGKERGREKKKR